MKITYSRKFIKNARSLSGKTKESVHSVIQSVEDASKIREIPNCSKLTGFNNIYRIRIGSYRAIFGYILHIGITPDGTIHFLNILPRNEAYSKQNLTAYRKNDRR